jgi:EmrB/QacA subfamily drug resistance transporter
MTNPPALRTDVAGSPAGNPGPAKSAPPTPGGGSEVPAPLPPAAIMKIIAGIMLAMFLSALEQTIVAPALPTIGVHLGDIESLSWVVTAYLLSATAVTPLFGKLSDIYGRRTILLICVAIFIVGSVACAVAPTMWTLIAARALQGLGGGGILPLAQTIIADLVPPRERARYQSYSAVMFMFASVIGPLLGGVLTDRVHWSLIFWINLPLGAAALIITYRSLHKLPRHERPHRLDVIGAALMVAAAIILMLAMTWGGTRYPWMSWQIAALLVASAVSWVLFALRLANAAEPLIPLTVLREPVVTRIVAVAFFSIGAIIGLSIYVPLYLELVLGASPSVSGLALISFTAGTVIGAFAAGRSLGRDQHYKRLPMAGLAIAIASLAVLAAAPSGLALGGVSVMLFLCGGGIGMMYPLTTVLIQNAVLPHQFGVVTGTLNFFRLLGGTIVVAGLGAIVLGRVDTSGGLASLDALVKSGVRPGTDFSSVFSWVFIAAALCLVVALACLAGIEERPLRGPAPEPAGAAAQRALLDAAE